jgi:hypothetical protein
MRLRHCFDPLASHFAASTFARLKPRRVTLAFACIAAAFLTCSAQTAQQAPPAKADTPSVNDTRAERERQIAEDNAKLLKLATELKSEIDKTTLDTLSLSVIHKASEIEKLAHSLKEKMKQTVGPAK